MKRIVILILIVLLLGTSIATVYLRRHWCWEISIDKAMFGDEELKGSSLYQCPDNILVIWLQSGEVFWGAYAIEVKTNRVGNVNSSNFSRFKTGLFSWHMPLEPVFLGEIQAKNDDINPRLYIGQNYIEFYPFNNDKKIMIWK
ncbi:MAG: hypothetical protein D6735_02125 [Acidobacteria bacterium]|nr:MAG: hypothetical protein D6735_02125 [Acidobacteriota bacterium]